MTLASARVSLNCRTTFSGETGTFGVEAVVPAVGTRWLFLRLEPLFVFTAAPETAADRAAIADTFRRGAVVADDPLSELATDAGRSPGCTGAFLAE